MISDREFVHTNPWLVSSFDVFSVNDPTDQPEYVGMVLRCVSGRHPGTTVTFTFKLPPALAGDPGAVLSLLAQ